MTEEIRTYLLNSHSYAGVVYIPKDYKEVILPSTFNLFRGALLGEASSDSFLIKSKRANDLVSAIYRDPLLAPIAMDLFDHRIIKKNPYIGSPSGVVCFSSIKKRVDQIPDLETIITSNDVTVNAVGDLYHTLVRPHQRVLCLLVAYACSLKNK